ncbi:unnamed protein product, partial [Closterium sp. NIES-54]
VQDNTVSQRNALSTTSLVSPQPSGAGPSACRFSSGSGQYCLPEERPFDDFTGESSALGPRVLGPLLAVFLVVQDNTVSQRNALLTTSLVSPQPSGAGPSACRFSSGSGQYCLPEERPFDDFTGESSALGCLALCLSFF